MRIVKSGSLEYFFPRRIREITRPIVGRVAVWMFVGVHVMPFSVTRGCFLSGLEGKYVFILSAISWVSVGIRALMDFVMEVRTRGMMSSESSPRKGWRTKFASFAGLEWITESKLLRTEAKWLGGMT